MTVNLMEMMTMLTTRNVLSSHLVKQIQYIAMVTIMSIMKTTMATKICNMTGDLDSGDICLVLRNANKWSEQYCSTQVTAMMGWW